MFGEPEEIPQSETTRFNPKSPYAIAKVFAYMQVKHYRDTYGLFASTAIFYNHESPRRTEEYVTRKITGSAVRIAKGLQDKLILGDLSAEIDWGYAKEYMETAWQILQQPKPDDYIIATGETHSVKEFLEETFQQLGLSVAEYVETSSKFIRPTKTGRLVGDISKAKRDFGYEPKVKFRELIKIMVNADVELIKNY